MGDDKTNTNLKKKSFQDIYIEMGVISKDEMDKALEKSKKDRKKISNYLLENKIINNKQFAQASAIHYNLQFKDLHDVIPSEAAYSQLPYEFAHKNCILPFELEGNILKLIVHDPISIMSIGPIKKTIKYDYIVFIGVQNEILDHIEKCYKKKVVSRLITTDIFTNKIKTTHFDKQSSILSTSTSASASISKDSSLSTSNNKNQVTVQTNKTDENESITLILNKIIERAIIHKSSDIHIEPDNEKLRVRERIDGILHEREIFPLEFHILIISRIKVMANLDIAEKRISQDGRFNYVFKECSVDFRVSTLPTVKGEKVVLRLLDKGNLRMNLDELDIQNEMLVDIKKILHDPHGIILVTGPTGSGKTTTVYSMLNYINDIEENIITVEDPVEYQFPVVNQVQVNTKVGLTFPVILRTILRQDPDVIMIGEIRDRETADIAIRAALTGHLVISTLHTNDSLKAIDRLIDIGIEPYLIVSSLLGIVSQRLIRRLCPHCKEIEDRIEKFNLLPYRSTKIDYKNKIFKHNGCEKCYHTGYLGRMAIYELLLPTTDIGRAIKNRSNIEELYLIAKKCGFKTIQENALSCLLDGLTTIDELIGAIGTSNPYESAINENTSYPSTTNTNNKKGDT
ncbi:MAG: Flp pilus assembly complex ATPase component TadA [Oligoflexia bacterium]|nr:Flp pilus assembly complex ATPase component TadA [Oligoflexia bacterium]